MKIRIFLDKFAAVSIADLRLRKSSYMLLRSFTHSVKDEQFFSKLIMFEDENGMIINQYVITLKPAVNV
jgi:hypothetical protein